ncbi:hypothetical protein ACFWU3_15315 [Streptomyces sp. NPDC058685]|uniref:hypothetical protein n=1 Tax=Streptomyces sp. NPDC058685 TaxID=3346598 RepID=UPI0036535BD2
MRTASTVCQVQPIVSETRWIRPPRSTNRRCWLNAALAVAVVVAKSTPPAIEQTAQPGEADGAKTKQAAVRATRHGRERAN